MNITVLDSTQGTPSKMVYHSYIEVRDFLLNNPNYDTLIFVSPTGMLYNLKKNGEGIWTHYAMAESEIIDMNMSLVYQPQSFAQSSNELQALFEFCNVSE